MPGESKVLTVAPSDIVGRADCGLSEVVLWKNGKAWWSQ